MVLTEHRVVEGGSRHAVRGATGLRLHDRPVPAGFRHDDASSDAGWDLVPGAVTATSSESVAERVSSLSRTDGSAPATPEQDGWCSDDTGGRLN